MTNEQIIFNESVELMKSGKIGKTGRQFEVEDEKGNKKVIHGGGYVNNDLTVRKCIACAFGLPTFRKNAVKESH